MKYLSVKLWIFLLLLNGCSADNISFPEAATPANDAPETIILDRDADGIIDTKDQWPDDPTLPVVSDLWGVKGESWSPASRLPLVAFAGFHEGKESLPETSRIVANVLDFGASNTEGSNNDATAFQLAIASARTQVSKDNPGIIYIPAGVYDIDEQLHLNVSGMILRGAGQGQTILRFSQGLVNDLDALGSDSRRRKLIVMGGNIVNDKLKTGLAWQQWNNAFSAALDVDNLPQRGDFSIRLKKPLSDTLKQHIIDQQYRIRLSQSMNYGENSETPVLAASIYGGPDFAAPGSNGGINVSQQFIVSIADDNQTLLLDRPLRFSPSDETQSGGARIAVQDLSQSWATQNIGIEHLTMQLPDTDWLEHFGTEGQGGIDMLSDNSWVQHVRLINADNGIEVDKHTFNNTISNVIISGTRVPRRSGPAEHRYDAYGHHGITLKGRDHLLTDFTLEVSYVHDVTMNNCHGCVVTRGSAPQMNMDHHRQGIYASVWTDLNLGSPHRMWASTGNPSEGFNAAAFNTFWQLRSTAPSLAYWPEDGNSYPQWGYHQINIIATDIQSKPMIGEGNRPYPYHPDNAHLETMKTNTVWPQNIYEAQLEAFRAGKLTGMESPVLHY